MISKNLKSKINAIFYNYKLTIKTKNSLSGSLTQKSKKNFKKLFFFNKKTKQNTIYDKLTFFNFTFSLKEKRFSLFKKKLKNKLIS